MKRILVTVCLAIFALNACVATSKKPTPTASQTTRPAMPTEPALTMEVQSALAEQGYDPGPADGVMGNRTKSALEQYQYNNGLPVTGQVDEATYYSLVHSLPASGGQAETGEALYEYNESFVWQGAGIGCILVGGLVYALTEDASDTIAACAAGAVAGGIGGHLLAENQKEYASEEARLDGQIAAADAELKGAKAARAAAERLTQQHKKELEAARANYEQGKITSAQAKEAVKSAEKDAEQMRLAKESLNQQIALLNNSIEATADSGRKMQLIERRDELRQQSEALDRQLQLLSDQIGQTNDKIA